MSDQTVNTGACVHCGACTATCLFLERYQIDLAEFARRPELAYSCFLCGKCRRTCPGEIDGSALALHMRKERAQQGAGEGMGAVYGGLLWEKSPYKFANYRKAAKKSVLFPGCNFPSFFPETTKRLEKMMDGHGIGVVYECCEKPVHELGLVERAAGAVMRMEKRLKRQGVEELVMVCPNCYHFLKDRIEIRMATVYEKLRELGEGKQVKMDELPIYYPCPDRTSREMFGHMRHYLDGEIKDIFEDIQCCGLGGSAAVREPELSRKMTEKVTERGGSLYTYCACCVSSFRRSGYMHAYHVLPLILGIDEKVPLGIQSLINRAKRIL